MSETSTIEKTEAMELPPLESSANVPAQAENGAVSRLNNLNTTGHRAYDKAVLVRMDEALEVVGRIFVPMEARDKQQLAELYGTVIQVGANAYSEARREVMSQNRDAMEDELLRAKMEGREPRPIPLKEFDCPQVGDRVTIARYAGVMLDPKKVGGGHVRMMNDEDIIAIVDE